MRAFSISKISNSKWTMGLSIRPTFTVIAAFALQIGMIIHSHCMAQQGDGLSLVASSPFRMILQPISAELDPGAVLWIEDSVPLLLLAEQPSYQPYLDMEIVVQEVEFLESRNTTRLRFFVLATMAVENDSTTGNTNPQNALNQHISDTFESSEIPGYFQTSGIPVLEDVQVVAVQEIVPANPPSPAPPTSSKMLSTLDIVLIAVSGAIFIGIAYMIVQHVKDRGYIENQRLIALNAVSVLSTQTNPTNEPHETVGEAGKGELQGTDTEKAPSTPSTVNSVTDVELNEVADAPETPERNQRPIRLTTVSTAQSEPNAPTDAPPELQALTDSTQQMAEPSGSAIPVQFDKNCFLEERSKDGVKTVKEMNPAETASSESDNSEDVFHIDIDALCADDARSKASSQSSAISEWMKTIRVVPTASAKTERTQSTSESQDKSSQEESSEPSLDHSYLELSSLECVSLNQSLASSTAGDDKSFKAGRLEV
jgi:hypothetical protein